MKRKEASLTIPNMKRSAKEKKLLAMEKIYLRRNLKEILPELLALTTKEEAIEIVLSSKSIPEMVRKLAYQLRNESGAENNYQISILGALSDLALKRMLPAEKSNAIDTPQQILSWFSCYLERMLDKKDLKLSNENQENRDINFGRAERGSGNPFAIESMRASTPHQFLSLST